MNNKNILILFTFVLGVLLISSCSVFRNKTENHDKIDKQNLVDSGIIPEGFIAVEKEPQVDLNKLMKCVEYPDISRRAGIQGRVIVRALIDIDGKVIKAVIEDTDNVTLNDAALKAVKDCADFKPAIVKGKPIICWVSIPITFRLKDPE